jgi:nucleoside recognition membrane protein YjiH
MEINIFEFKTANIQTPKKTATMVQLFVSDVAESKSTNEGVVVVVVVVVVVEVVVAQSTSTEPERKVPSIEERSDSTHGAGVIVIAVVNASIFIYSLQRPRMANLQNNFQKKRIEIKQGNFSGSSRVELSWIGPARTSQ